MKIRTVLGRWWREPLLHFLAIGALLFLVFNWRGGSTGSNRIVITPGQLEAISATFARTWQRPPNDAELKALVDDYVRDEIATREAMALGLDQDDIAIRRRLRMKFEYAAGDLADATPPNDADLQKWLETHSAAFRADAVVSFRHVYLNADRRGSRVEAEARRLLEKLRAAGAPAPLDGLGDPFMLPADVTLNSRTDIARQYGSGFAESLLQLEPGRWEGPVRSGLGLHLVVVTERQEGHLPTLAEARPQVEREFLAERRKRELDALYNRLRANYTVVLEGAPGRSAAPGATQ